MTRPGLWKTLRSLGRRGLTHLRYPGTRLHCPMCGGRFGAFLPRGLDQGVYAREQVVGAGRREAATCPYCYSSDRERFVHLYLREVAGLARPGPPLRVLHVAPERNLRAWLRSLPRVRYVGSGLSSRWVDVFVDLTRAPFGDGAFDVILCNHVLEHVPDDHAALVELRRILAPRGFAIVQVPLAPGRAETEEASGPTDAAERVRRFGQAGHLRLYGRDYPDRVRAAGFEVEEVDPAQAFGADAVGRHSLLADERLVVARREE